MEACAGVERELNNVSDKFTSFRSKSERELLQTIEDLRGAKDKMQSYLEENPEGGLNPSQTLMLVTTLQSVRETTSKLGSDHRELHSSVSKVGKAIDRNFVTDYDSTSRPDVFSLPDRQRMLNEVVLQHFYRQGQLEISETLAAEAGVEENAALAKAPFQELNAILEALKVRNLGPALDWAMRHRDELNLRGTTAVSALIALKQNNNSRNANNIGYSSWSALEMKLHQLHFISLLADGKGQDAISYARINFPPFTHSHEKEIQSLMGALMYAQEPGRLASSPYKDLLSDTHWSEAGELFVKDACALIGLSVESPLSVAINAGCKTLPALLNIKQVMQQRQVSGVWNAKDELPIEIDLGPDCRYHSIFACPILRQQTTENNPPMKLNCGHCISRLALNKLASGHKFKCPYCPVEQNAGEAVQITF